MAVFCCRLWSLAVINSQFGSFTIVGGGSFGVVNGRFGSLKIVNVRYGSLAVVDGDCGLPTIL